MRLSIVACCLVLGVLSGLHGALAEPPALGASPEARNEPIRALMKYLWPVLSSAKSAGRVYYRAVCPPDDYYPLKFPRIDVERPLSAGTELAVVRSMFRHVPGVTATEDDNGMVRVRIGEVPDAVLQTRISALSFDAVAQYNLPFAIAAIERAPEVQSVMRKLNVSVPPRYYNYLVQQPAQGYPHLPAEISNVTMDQALDMVARTWSGVVFYGACTGPATYEIFFADSPYFEGRRSGSRGRYEAPQFPKWLQPPQHRRRLQTEATASGKFQ